MSFLMGFAQPIGLAEVNISRTLFITFSENHVYHCDRNRQHRLDPKGSDHKYNITVAPQVLIWGEETLNDGVDIQPEEFYRAHQNRQGDATTSQVSIVTMQNIFSNLVEKGFDVLGIFVSSKLPGQRNRPSRDARRSPKKEKVHIFDSNSTAMAMGFPGAGRGARGRRRKRASLTFRWLPEKARDHTVSTSRWTRWIPAPRRTDRWRATTARHRAEHEAGTRAD